MREGPALDHRRGAIETQWRVLIALCRPFNAGGSFATPATNQQIAGELFLSVATQ
jgi:hypothetical protein